MDFHYLMKLHYCQYCDKSDFTLYQASLEKRKERQISSNQGKYMKYLFRFYKFWFNKIET